MTLIWITMLKYIILGIVQGFTEFFPVSSSGHLIIFQKILGISGQELVLSVVLHFGTVLALIIFFFKDIIKILRSPKMMGLIIIITIITGVIGIIGKDYIENLFTSVRLVAFALMVTGVTLILTRKFMQGKRENLGVKDAVILGITQAIAIIPGISRSGTTISTLLFKNVDKQTSFRFSFIASIPVVLGAVILEAKDISYGLKINFANFTAGFIASFVSGLLALWILKLILAKAKLYYFGYYCILVGIIALFI
ncbi:MAG: undecaprenyl-diphosphate phosphatase [Candidatus Omnitrophota bacterium]